MIISILEDGSITIYDTAEDARREHEGADVESGTVTFYDANGEYLAPVFTKPNTYGIFGVASGDFTLEPRPLPPHVDPLPIALSEATHLTPRTAA